MSSFGHQLDDPHSALREEISELEALERREKILQKLEAICGPKVEIRSESNVPAKEGDAHWDHVMKEMVRKMVTNIPNKIYPKFFRELYKSLFI